MGFSEDFQGLRWMIPRGYHVKRGVNLERGGIFQILSYFLSICYTPTKSKTCVSTFLFVETNQRIIGLLVNKKSKPRTCKIW